MSKNEQERHAVVTGPGQALINQFKTCHIKLEIKLHNMHKYQMFVVSLTVHFHTKDLLQANVTEHGIMRTDITHILVTKW